MILFLLLAKKFLGTAYHSLTSYLLEYLVRPAL